MSDRSRSAKAVCERQALVAGLERLDRAVRMAQQRLGSHPDEQAVLDYARDLLDLAGEGRQVGHGGELAVQDQVALVGDVRLAVVAQPLLGVGQQAVSRRRVSRQPKRTTSTGSRNV